MEKPTDGTADTSKPTGNPSRSLRAITPGTGDSRSFRSIRREIPPESSPANRIPHLSLVAGIALLGLVSLIVLWLRAPGSEISHPDVERRDSTRPARAPRSETRDSLELSGAPLRADSPGWSTPAPLGPTGARVSLVGRVTGISMGRALIECQGRHYMTVHGLPLEPPRPGDPIRVEGNLLGASEDGLFYLEASRP